MIGRLLTAVQRLQGRTAHELITRGRQQAYAWSERASLRFGSDSPSRVAVPEAAGDAMFARPFFPGVRDVAATLDSLAFVAPDDSVEVLQRAGAIANGEIQLFGHGPVHIGRSPDWQRDPLSNLVAPSRHWSTIPYLDPAIAGDHKVVWEINRHQYFVTIGQAWLYSRDEKWPALFVTMLNSWILGNPPTVGMNWASSLEVSYRAISWVWALQLMRGAPGVDHAFKERVLASLQSHGRHLERYLSTYFSPNTHLTGEALGLYYLGAACPELPQANRWLALGANVLESALPRQVLADGVYFEQASQYHRYTIDIYLHYLLLAGAGGRPVGAGVKPALNSLFDVLLQLTRGDGTIPLIGDDDGGRLVQLDGRPPHDVRALLATGAVVLQRSDLAFLGRGDDAALCWMLGADAPASRDALVREAPPGRAHAFAVGGIYTMRDGWKRHDAHAVIDAGPHGAGSYGHSHADALAMEIALGGTPLFVDPGTYTYVGAERNAFRTTAAHNTVEIDGVSTSDPGSAFRWRRVAHAHATGWAAESDFTYFTGAHDAYASLASPVQHSRAVLHPASGFWVVRDELLTTGAHDAVVRWHCAAGLVAQLEQQHPGCSVLAITEAGARRAFLAVFGSGAGAMHVEGGWVSRQFGHREPAAVCAWRERLNGNGVIISIIMDADQYELVPDVLTGYKSRIGGAAAVHSMRVRNASLPEHILVLVGNGQPMTFDNLEITAHIACLRVDASCGVVTSVTAVGVSSAAVNGSDVVPAGRENRWLVATPSDAVEGGVWQARTGAITPPSAPSAPAPHGAGAVLSHV